MWVSYKDATKGSAEVRNCVSHLPPLYPAVLYKYWFMASTIPYLCTSLSPVFVANPHAGREGNIDALVRPLHAPLVGQSACSGKPGDEATIFSTNDRTIRSIFIAIDRFLTAIDRYIAICNRSMFYAIDRFLTAIDRYLYAIAIDRSLTAIDRYQYARSMFYAINRYL